MSVVAIGYKTITQVCRDYGLQRRFVYNLVKQSAVRAIQPSGYGTRYFINTESIEAFLRRNGTYRADVEIDVSEEENDYQDMLERMGFRG